MMFNGSFPEMSFPEEEAEAAVYDLAFELTRKTCNSAQASLVCLQQVFGMQNETLVRAAFPFEGGLAFTTGGTCGALTGCSLFIGQLLGDGTLMERDPTAMSLCEELVSRVAWRFVEKYGSIRCRDVHVAIFERSFNLQTKLGFEEFRSAGAPQHCPDIVGKACLWTLDVLKQAKGANMHGDQGNVAFDEQEP